jgi:sulfur-oxidizing protein SoxY
MKRRAMRANLCPQPCTQRRRLLQHVGAIAALGVTPLPKANAAARTVGVDTAGAAFAAKTFAEAIGALGSVPVPSSLVTLDAPAIAENGAAVPIMVRTALPGVCEILLLVDGNPQPVAARFAIPSDTEPFVATRIRMAGEGTVYAVIRTDDGRLHAAACAIQVTVGGCS